MTLTLSPELEQALARRAQENGTTLEQAALDMLRQSLLPRTNSNQEQDAWTARLRRLASPAGVSLPEEALSREALYD
jgi:hypothetical protein